MIDQAALHGLLNKLLDTGLPLISVARLEPDPPETDMTTTVRTPAVKRASMSSPRKHALVAACST